MARLKYLKIFEEFNKSKKEKMLDKIKSFFKCDYVAKRAVELHPKLAIWIIKTFKDLLIKEYPSIKDELETYLKTGQNENKYIKLVIKKWNDLSSKYQTIIDWVKSHDISEEDRKNFSKMTFDEALNKAKEWHNSLKSSGKAIKDEHGEILMTFPDGFYWIDLQKTYDEYEAESMGHCGRTNKGDTLISLRDKYKRPHITAAINTSEGIIYQMKGKGNSKPAKKYHKYIVALLTNDNLPFKINGFGSEYKYEDDFSPYDLDKELFDELISKKPNITKKIYSDEEIFDLYKNLLYKFYNDDEYFFDLVERAYSLGGIEIVIDSLNNRNDILFNILKKEFFDEKDIIDEEKLKIIHNICSFHCNANHAAEYFKIKLPNPKDSNSGKWHYIIKQVPIEKLEEYIKKEGLEEYYKDELSSSKFSKNIEISYKKISGEISYYYDYEYMLNRIFDYDLEKAFEYLKKLFNENGKYKKYVRKVWDAHYLIYYINENTPRKEKIDELIEYGYIDD